MMTTTDDIFFQPIKRPPHIPIKKRTESILNLKIMQVVLPTFAVFAATYIFLSHIPKLAIPISLTAAGIAFYIGYKIIKRYYSLPLSPKEDFSPINLHRQRQNSKSALGLIRKKR